LDLASALFAMTMTLADLFAPLAFPRGLTGALFREFAVTLAGSVVLSGVIAITITPMMSARLLKPGNAGRFQRIVDGTFSRVEHVYERAVTGS
ncbi:efflux RND transporter permease subunit, partial [bacterium M00.F.Ca.ET.152.01.1.1]